MIIRVFPSFSVASFLSISMSLMLGACSGSEATTVGGNGGTAGNTGTPSGGSPGVGGAGLGGTSSNGAGGANAGAPSTGGNAPTGGSNSSAGAKATGGMLSTGGAKATGGTVTNGGAAGTGGSKATGGLNATGGSKATGGTTSTGGSKGTGGVPATGGSKGTGGAPATGGAKATGGSSATSTTCSFPSGWAPGSPTYTTYSLPNAQTACGYNGSNNTIKNIAVGANFAAIPDGSSNFANGNRCGACVQIGSAIVTIVDECPTSGGQNAPCAANLTGHLDLSTAAASAAGVKGDPSLKNQASWKFIPCPVTGNVVVRLKSGNNNEFYIENEIVPIASVTCGGQPGTRQSYGAWHFSASSVAGVSCTATDIAGRSITFTVGSTQGQDVDSGQQFP